MPGITWKILQFASKVRSNLHYFLYIVYGMVVDSGTRKLNFTQNFDIGHKKGLSQQACSISVLYCVCNAKSGKNCRTLQFVSKARPNLN